mmetsp:Transcript_9557/g.28759  ORF Transcript_9557/g.28759 Transcript_9557/m.28759 type:complete len:603 (-) Transcript_9557:2583-4391(-)
MFSSHTGSTGTSRSSSEQQAACVPDAEAEGLGRGVDLGALQLQPCNGGRPQKQTKRGRDPWQWHERVLPELLASARNPAIGHECRLEEDVKLAAGGVIHAVLLQAGVEGHQGVLGADVQVVVNLPVHLPHLPRRVPQPLQGVAQDDGGAKCKSAAVNGAIDGIDYVGAGLKDIGPHVVEQVHQRILAPQPCDTEGHVLHHGGGGLAVHQVAVHEGVLQQRRHRVDVVLPHLPDVLEQEAQRLQHPVLHIKLRHLVLVHEGGQHGEGGTSLGDNGDGDGGAHAVLPLLHLQVVQQRHQHVLRPDGLSDVPERVHRRSPDALLVRLQHLQKLEADAHPLASRDMLCAAVGNAPHQVDAVLLHLLVPILQDGRQARQQVLDGRRHLGHPDHVHDGLEGAQHRTQDLGVLLAQGLEQHHPQVPQQLLLVARLHHHRDARDQVRRLLPNFGRLVIEAPLDGPADLRQIGLGAPLKAVHNGAEPVQHHVGVVGHLLLEGVQDAIDQQLLQPCVDVGGAQLLHYLVDSLHDHTAVGFRLVLEVLHDAAHDLGAPRLLRHRHRGLHQLPVVAPVQRHAPHPEVPEELRQDLIANVVRRHALCTDALGHDL